MDSFLKKGLYYKDIKLLFSIFLDILYVSFTPNKSRLPLANIVKPFRSSCDTKKLKKYINFCFFIMQRMGIRPSCLTRSVIVCRILRSRGIDARIVFGCTWIEEQLKGHCWVQLDELPQKQTYFPVFSYPFCQERRL